MHAVSEVRSGSLCPSVETIADYVGGRLAPSGLDELEIHLDTCSDCARVVVEAAGWSRERATPSRLRPRIFQPDQVISGRYEIVSFLGAGGMGEVYEARDRELGDRIALKTISAAISLDPAAVSRFKAEVQLARKVTHRNVCRVFEFGIHVDREGDAGAPALTPFLTMELIRGRALSDYIRGGTRFTNDEALSVARQVARGLEAAHEAGILHRDLKSDNVLLLPASRDHFRVVLTDFGLAAAVIGDGGDPGLSRGSSVYGTRAYLAPERLAGVRATPASDVYSLGVVMYELVAGSMSGEGAEPTTFAGLPASAPMAPIVRACLAREAKKRPANAAEVLSALDDLARAAPVRTTTGSATRRPESTRPRIWLWALGTVVAGGLAVSLLFRGAHGGGAAPSHASAGSNAGEARQPAIAPPPPPALQPTLAVSAPPVAAASATPVPAPAKPIGRKPPRTPAPKADALGARQLLESAEQRLRSGSIDEACLLGREAVHRAAELPAAWEFLGRCLMRLGEPREARLCYGKFLALSPNDSKAVFVKAIIEEEQ
jgi:serine/threonine protein kinase